MPTYEYECSGCRRVFEVKQRISEPPLTTCDACGGPVRRLLSAAPFILKGDGWYVTDYPSESRKKASESEKTATTTASSATPAPSTGSPAPSTGSPAPSTGSPAPSPAGPAPSSSPSAGSSSD